MLFIAIIITIIIAILSLMPIGEQPIKINNLDKIEHAIAYFFLTLTWLLALGKNKKAIAIIIAVSIFYGIIIEILQVTLTSHRVAEYLDALANSIGVVMALFVFLIFLRKKQSI